MTFRTYSIQEIEAGGGDIQASTLCFKGHQFQRGPKCRKALQNSIEIHCKRLLKAGLGFALVEEDETYITIWKQSQGFIPGDRDEDNALQQAKLDVSGGKSLAQTDPDPPAPCLTPEFTDHCRQALLITIGPIANIIVDETLADGLDASEFMEVLIRRLPDQKQITMFQELVRASQNQDP